MWQALEANASLQSLLLAGNAFMGPDGAKAIGNMLTFNDSLTALDLSGCGIFREVRGMFSCLLGACVVLCCVVLCCNILHAMLRPLLAGLRVWGAQD